MAFVDNLRRRKKADSFPQGLVQLHMALTLTLSVIVFVIAQ
jgi:hypothetical protein